MRASNRIPLILVSIILAPGTLFSATQVDPGLLRPGLEQLFDGRLSENEMAAIMSEANEFKTQYDQYLEKIPQALVQLKVNRKNAEFLKFSIPSLMERPGHPSNDLIGEIYFPAASSDCFQKYPATLILHHVGDDLGPEQTVARLAAGGRQGVIMLIYLPDYGPRKSAGESFIVNDFERFRMKVLQSLLDTRLAFEILSRQPEVENSNVKLMGISLGGILTLISAGVDPVFNQYATLVGGADLAHIMAYRKEANPQSETSRALKDIQWTVAEARRKLAAFDALTWSGNVHGKKILMLNAKNDELINPELGVQKIANLFRAQGNEVEVRFHAGSHRPNRKEIGLLGMFKDLYLPTMGFLGEGKVPQCE